jgi:endoglucanase Acf2
MPQEFPRGQVESGHWLSGFWIRIIACGLIVFGLSNSSTAQQETIRRGPGSYTTLRPEPCKPLPETIFKVDSLDGPTPTNQWWSSLAWEKFSSNMFPHPLGVLAFDKGLSVSYPGSGIVGAENAIMGGGVNSNGDIVIGLDGVTFEDSRVADFSDWFVTAQFSSEQGNLKTTFGHGCPFVYCEKDTGKIRLKFAIKPSIWHGDKDSNTIGITVRGNRYGLFAATGSKWSIEDETSVVLESEQKHFSLALLPDKDAETLEKFSLASESHVSGSDFRYTFEGGELVTTLKVAPDPKANTNGPSHVFALYPHQWKYSDNKVSDSNYKSVRGEMKLLFGGDSFQTRVPIQGVLPFLPLEGIPDRGQMLKYLDAEIAKDSAAFGDTYWEGKHLGKLASLSGICEAMGETARQKFFIDELKRRMEDWFVAEEKETSPMFYYNRTWGTLIGSRPSYGSDDQINDHHFHYGYFIRAAAEVARVDPEWAKKWAPMVELIIGDIASGNATKMFPRLRGFDIYAGHSWASGHARFGDGNNQESSSESMNAWYGMMMWGEATGNVEVRDLGAFLFNAERTAMEEYWLDVSGTNYPETYPNVAVGMVWGGKGAYATWFSGDADHIQGINWLPFTPASVYLGRFPTYVESNYQSVMKKRENGLDLNKGWGDLVVMFGALSDSNRAASYIDSNPNCNIEGGNSHAFMYHWIHSLNEFGHNDASVTADHLFANVFVRDGKKTYVAYNFHDRRLTVRFSDGTRMSSKTKGLFLKR